MIISRTPFRISFFGGGSDFPEYYTKYGGATLSTTINKYCYLSVHRLSSFFKYNFRASYAKTELVQTPDEFQHPLVRECLKFKQITTGMEIAHISDLPGRTGLGTSSAFTVGLLNALYTFKREQATTRQLAEQAICIERDWVGDPGGHQDQYATAHGGFLHIGYSADGVAVRELELRPQRSCELQSHLLLFYTGVEQSASEVLKDQKQHLGKNTDTLRKMVDMVDDAKAVLSSGGDIRAFGDLLHETWQMKRGLAQGISNTAIDQAYSTGRKAGAIGGKLLGAGGRGFLLLFAEPGSHTAIRKQLHPMQEVPFAFSNIGTRIILDER
ncbi:MAG: kinase [Spartobacteria bacterium]|nr:kinase [Spartobacteria bacterium]